MAELLSQEEIDNLLAGLEKKDPTKTEEFGIFDRIEDPVLIRKLIAGTDFDTPYFLAKGLIPRYPS